jgi:hypothetical protein
VAEGLLCMHKALGLILSTTKEKLLNQMANKSCVCLKDRNESHIKNVLHEVL